MGGSPAVAASLVASQPRAEKALVDSETTRPPKRRSAALVAVALAATLGALSLRLRPRLLERGATTLATVTPNATRSYNATQWDWMVYKATIATPPGSYKHIVPFVNSTLAPTEVFCLGCEGVKSYANVANDVGLHFVEAPALTEGPVPLVEWVDFFERVVEDALEGNQWNAFMHNRVQLYTSSANFLAHYDAIAAYGGNVTLLGRRTTGYVHDGDETVEVAHLLFHVTGRVYELAAPVLGDATLAALAAAWPVYGESECEAAMRLPSRSVDLLDAYYREKAAEYYASSEFYAAWIDEKGFAPPVLLDIQVSARDAAQTVANWVDVAAPLSPQVVDLDVADCVARRVSVSGHLGDIFGRFQPSLTYVENRAAPGLAGGDAFEHTVADWDAYVERVHDHMGTNSEWGWGMDWNHFLDTHVGFQYEGTGTCSNDTIGLLHYFDTELEAKDVNVGQRTGHANGQYSQHFYCGKWGAVAWEFNVLGCDRGSRDRDANVCTCNRENNGGLYTLQTDGVCADTCDSELSADAALLT